MPSGKQGPIAVLVLLASLAAMAPAAAFADKPDVLIKFDSGTGRITEVKPQVKGLCFSPDDKKGDCDNHVTWRVTKAMGTYKIQIAPQKGQHPCFPKASFPLVIDQKGPAGQKDSGAADGKACPRGTTWKYELQVIDGAGNAGELVDPFVVFDN
ncbi:MAG TPA: hypothetical protein VMS86_13740 [Thermoanaerobaculia bacterium]|nr:hypothetical protein [Thermoanaerobaculia bacterium]